MRYKKCSRYNMINLQDNEPIEFFGLPGSMLSSALGYIRVRSKINPDNIQLIHRDNVTYELNEDKIPSYDELVRICKKML